MPEAAIVRPMTVAQPETAVRGTGAVQPVGDLVRADTVELMRQLQATDESAVAAARAELIRRKFTPAHLEAARRLFHADTEVRKGLARTLPETPGLDAVPWLLWLARDPEARRAVVGRDALGDDRRSGRVGAGRGHRAQRFRPPRATVGRATRPAAELAVDERGTTAV